MDRITFEQLPQAVALIHEKLNSIEQLLLQKNNPQAEVDEQMTVGQAANFLNLSVSALYGKVCRAEVPVNKRGKRLYFFKSELSAWIREGRKKTCEEIRKEQERLPAVRRRHNPNTSPAIPATIHNQSPKNPTDEHPSIK
ncbi:MAG TPA: helix-turn-helix domain-containing protein [Chitinophaga sp.]|uniref:helix-turn-helix domain-containing protein n=1 Tax=Chitinophaga sp. TaxID=1869181 RepID=UPI002B673FF9|nr:helix-turn-helix domain-containing protein [Chitinophaga sp.]HVI49229.1 helix-turn-helix domain-containing protein [Chitinophaga sp.]